MNEEKTTDRHTKHYDTQRATLPMLMNREPEGSNEKQALAIMALGSGLTGAETAELVGYSHSHVMALSANHKAEIIRLKAQASAVITGLAKSALFVMCQTGLKASLSLAKKEKVKDMSPGQLLALVTAAQGMARIVEKIEAPGSDPDAKERLAGAAYDVDSVLTQVGKKAKGTAKDKPSKP